MRLTRPECCHGDISIIGLVEKISFGDRLLVGRTPKIARLGEAFMLEALRPCDRSQRR